VAPFELFGRNFCLVTLQHHFSSQWSVCLVCVCRLYGLLKPVYVPPPAQPELRIPAGRAGTAAGRNTCRTGTAGRGGAERALLCCQMAEFRAAGPKNGPVKLLAA
jgi:hypothetical protein